MKKIKNLKLIKIFFHDFFLYIKNDNFYKKKQRKALKRGL